MANWQGIRHESHLLGLILPASFALFCCASCYKTYFERYETWLFCDETALRNPKICYETCYETSVFPPHPIQSVTKPLRNPTKSMFRNKKVEGVT